MASRKLTIDVTDRLRNTVADVEAPALDPSDCRKLPIIDVLPSGRVDIIDGYHRIAGMVRFGAESIECVTSDDADLLADAADCEDTERQAKAIAAIYASL